MKTLMFVLQILVAVSFAGTGFVICVKVAMDMASGIIMPIDYPIAIFFIVLAFTLSIMGAVLFFKPLPVEKNHYKDWK